MTIDSVRRIVAEDHGGGGCTIGYKRRHDRVDEIADKLIEAFEPFSETLLLEQIAVPEDLDDPQALVDLWVVGAEVQPLGDSPEQAIVIRGTASVPTGAVIELDTEGLTSVLRDGLLRSPELREARLTARLASVSAESGGIPSSEDAQRN